MTEQKKILKLVTPTTKEAFRSQRALTQYIAMNCRPDICATLQLIAPGNARIENRQFKSLKKSITNMKDTSGVGL